MAVAAKAMQSSVSSSASSFCSSSAAAKRSTKPPPALRKPAGKSHQQMENEIMKGLRIQQSWQEKPDIQFLTMSVLHLCKLAPTASDQHWAFGLNGAKQTFDHCCTRLARVNASSFARYQDSVELALEMQRARDCMKSTEEDLQNARQDLVQSKRKRKLREEYERISRDISKKASLAELRRAQQEELAKKEMVESLAEVAQRRIAHRQRQAAVVLQVAADLKKALKEPIPGIDC